MMHKSIASSNSNPSMGCGESGNTDICWETFGLSGNSTPVVLGARTHVRGRAGHNPAGIPGEHLNSLALPGESGTYQFAPKVIREKRFSAWGYANPSQRRFLMLSAHGDGVSALYVVGLLLDKGRHTGTRIVPAPLAALPVRVFSGYREILNNQSTEMVARYRLHPQTNSTAIRQVVNNRTI